MKRLTAFSRSERASVIRSSPEASSESWKGVYFDVRSDGPAVTLTALTGGGYFGDRARIIISEHDTDLPLFLYFAPTAMHGPLSAPSHTIHKYAALLEGFAEETGGVRPTHTLAAFRL